MKKVFNLLLVLVLLCTLFTACSKESTLEKVKKHIENEEFAEAYDLLYGIEKRSDE